MDTKIQDHFEVLEIVAESPEFGFVLLCDWFGNGPAPAGGAVCTDAHGNIHNLTKVEAVEDEMYVVRLPSESLSTFGRTYRDVKAERGDCLWMKE